MPEARPATRPQSGDGKARRLPGFQLRSTAYGSRTDRLSRRALILAGLVLGSAAAGAPAQHGEPEATLAAHGEHGRLVFDRLLGTGAAELVVPGGLHWPGTPFELQAGGRSLAVLRAIGPGEVQVDERNGDEARAAGRVEPRWEDGAIRLTLRTPDGQAFETGFFDRPSASGSPEHLCRSAANTILDVRGKYRAVLRNPSGRSVGWLTIRVDLSGTPVRSYEGALPDVITPGLAAATALALDTEIDWIETHAGDVYRGD